MLVLPFLAPERYCDWGKSARKPGERRTARVGEDAKGSVSPVHVPWTQRLFQQVLSVFPSCCQWLHP